MASHVNNLRTLYTPDWMNAGRDSGYSLYNLPTLYVYSWTHPILFNEDSELIYQDWILYRLMFVFPSKPTFCQGQSKDVYEQDFNCSSYKEWQSDNHSFCHMTYGLDFRLLKLRMIIIIPIYKNYKKVIEISHWAFIIHSIFIIVYWPHLGSRRISLHDHADSQWL